MRDKLHDILAQLRCIALPYLFIEQLIVFTMRCAVMELIRKTFHVARLVRKIQLDTDCF